MGEREGATAGAVKEEEQVNREKGGGASQWGEREGATAGVVKEEEQVNGEKGKGQQPGW